MVGALGVLVVVFSILRCPLILVLKNSGMNYDTLSSFQVQVRMVKCKLLVAGT